MMWFIEVFIVAPAWGSLSARLIIQSVIFIFTAFFQIAGLFMNKSRRGYLTLSFIVALALSGCFAGLFYGASYLVDYLNFKDVNFKGFIFWITFVFYSLYFINQLPLKLRLNWGLATDPNFKDTEFYKEMKSIGQAR